MRVCYTHIYYFNMNIERTSSDKEPLFTSTGEEIWTQHLHLLAHRSFLRMPQCCAIALCIYCCDEVQELMKENALCFTQCHQEQHLHRWLRMSFPSTIQRRPCSEQFPLLRISEEALQNKQLWTRWDETLSLYFFSVGIYNAVYCCNKCLSGSGSYTKK
jgi:hypothetical protein